MIRRSVASVFLIALSACAMAVSSASQGRAGLALDCQTLPLLTTKMMAGHVATTGITPELKRRFVALFAERVDPTETLLSKPEFELLKKRIATLFDSTLNGQCDGLMRLQADELKWQRQLEAFVAQKLSEKSFELDPSLELQLDPDKRPRAADGKELAELRLKMLQFQLASTIEAGDKQAAAVKKLIHRYELASKRVSERTQADLFADFVKTFALALDPHSSYYSAEDLEDFRINMNLSLEGIGAVLSSRDGYTIVEEIVTGGAAARQGELKVKDRIIAVAQGDKAPAVNVIDMALGDVVRKIRGKKGTRVKLTVLRQGDTTKTLTIVITRDKIDLAEQAAKLRWKTIKRDGRSLKLAFLELPSFYGGSAPGARDATRDTAKLLKEVAAKNADGLVLDLSSNGGGLLQGAIDISGLFIAQGPVVGVSDGTGNVMLKDEDPKVAYSGPLVVLTSRLSASASEILAGALKDYGRAVIVGDDHTYGKGSVQNIVQLPPGMGALKITNALFFRPGGQSTQGVGIGADIRIPSPFALPNIGERHNKFALATRKIPSFLGKQANASSGRERWKPVTDITIARLAKRSTKRLSASKAFKKLRDKLAKDAKGSGRVKLATLMDGKDSRKRPTRNRQPTDKLSIQAGEALEILADLVADGDMAAAKRP